jgi:hypothetical protein
MASPLVQEKAARRIDPRERLRWVFAPLAVSLQILEAGTVTFSLARLPERYIRVLLIRWTDYNANPEFRNSTKVPVVPPRFCGSPHGTYWIVFVPLQETMNGNPLCSEPTLADLRAARAVRLSTGYRTASL